MQPSSRPPRILIADDEVMIAMELADILEQNGCDVGDSVGDVETAKGIAGGGSFDIALLDVTLRGRSVEPIAALLTERGIPCGLVTAYPRHVLPPRLQRFPSIAKPFTTREVVDLAADLLAQRKQCAPRRRFAPGCRRRGLH